MESSGFSLRGRENPTLHLASKRLEGFARSQATGVSYQLAVVRYSCGAAAQTCSGLRAKIFISAGTGADALPSGCKHLVLPTYSWIGCGRAQEEFCRVKTRTVEVFRSMARHHPAVPSASARDVRTYCPHDFKPDVACSHKPEKPHDGTVTD